METPFDISGDLPVRFPEPPADVDEIAEHLLDVGAALELWERARDAEREAMARLVAAVDTAREDHDEPLAAIVAVMRGRTRQYVQKLLRRAETERQHVAYLEARYNPEAARRSLGRTGGYDRPQCGGCKRFLKARGDQCPSCGYLDGGGYFSVPAQTSHLERWR